MKFSVIYSCDVPRNTKLIAPPPSQSHLWECTEKDGGPEGGQNCGGREWQRGRHRKYCAWLSQEQFDIFVEHASLFAEDVHTMGSIGAPGFGFSLAPAISFTGDDCDTVQSAYVTPITDRLFVSPEDQPSLPGFEDVLLDAIQAEATALWEETRSQIIETYA